MELDPADMTPVVNRLKRAQGQLAAVTRMIEDGQDCTAVVTQLSAVSKALDRAGFALIATSMEKCLTSPDPGLDKKEREKVFLSLAGRPRAGGSPEVQQASAGVMRTGACASPSRADGPDAPSPQVRGCARPPGPSGSRPGPPGPSAIRAGPPEPFVSIRRSAHASVSHSCSHPLSTGRRSAGGGPP